jgi:hypothetical protein
MFSKTESVQGLDRGLTGQRVFDPMNTLRRNALRHAARRLLPAAAMLALLTATAAAQFPMPKVSLQPEERKLTPDELERQKAIDKAYRATTSKIPEKKADDPWGNVRAAPDTASKSASKKKQQ